jgi:hypothetical protein
MILADVDDVLKRHDDRQHAEVCIPVSLPKQREMAGSGLTGQQVGERTCCERLVCSSRDDGRLLTSCRRSSWPT